MKPSFLFTAFAAVLVQLSVLAQTPSVHYTEAKDLTLVGNLFPDTPNPYHRMDTLRYPGLEHMDYLQATEASGLSVAFKTNSKNIRILTDYGFRRFGVFAAAFAPRGYDLYIRENGKWCWAGACVADDAPDKSVPIVQNMDGTMHECLLYLPLYSELRGLEIGVEEGAVIEAIPVPFRHRVAIYGSSYTHGVSCSRAGMTYPAQFARHTGIQLLSLGMSGQCKMQPYSLQALEAVDAEAFIFDTFSNPSIAEIRERLFPFIERLQAAHPGVPLIFQRTIYREGRNFDKGAERAEQGRIDVADSLMAIACKRYKDVYYIHPNATEKDHETSVDGIHPSDHGYGVWALSIERQVLRILRRYGIR
jgi:hypothetical protein